VVSYCAIVYNEIDEIERLLSFLTANLHEDDEIIVVQSYKHDDEQLSSLFRDIASIITKFTKSYFTFKFQNNFSDMKNFMNQKATKNYIFNLDADEMISVGTLHSIRNVIMNNNIDLYYLPRINTVLNYADADIKAYAWTVNEHQWINWPDYQPRIYKNNGLIRWAGAVHEQIVGHSTHAFIDADPNYAIIHTKTIEKQRQQNNLYSQINR
jgi:hypothetical protein